MKGAQWPAPWRVPVSAWPKQRDVGDLRWQDEAECRDVDDETSDRLVEARHQADVDDLILTLCARCPVATACAEAGQAWRADGAWGGRVLQDGQPADQRKAAS